MPEVIDECLIVGDIAGQFDAMRRLLNKAPDVLPVSVGDMIDRGPKSREVVAFFQAHGKAVLGNHEHMCADFISNGYLYNRMIWLANGGDATVLSFGGKSGADMQAVFENSGLLEYIDALPVCLALAGGGLVTHAPSVRLSRRRLSATCTRQSWRRATVLSGTERHPSGDAVLFQFLVTTRCGASGFSRTMAWIGRYALIPHSSRY